MITKPRSPDDVPCTLKQYIAGCEGDSPTLSSYECYEVELAVNHLQNYLRSGDHLGVLISVYGT